MNIPSDHWLHYIPLHLHFLILLMPSFFLFLLLLLLIFFFYYLVYLPPRLLPPTRKHNPVDGSSRCSTGYPRLISSLPGRGALAITCFPAFTAEVMRRQKEWCSSVDKDFQAFALLVAHAVCKGMVCVCMYVCVCVGGGRLDDWCVDV